MRPLLTFVALAGVALGVAACGSEDTDDQTATVSPAATATAPITQAPTATSTPLAEEYPVTLAGIEFQPTPSTGPEWMCDPADEERLLDADLRVLAGTPFQIFGDGLPGGLAPATGPEKPQITLCDGRTWMVSGPYVVEGAPSVFTVNRILRPEAWTPGRVGASPADIKVVSLSGREVAVLVHGSQAEAWYVTPIDGGFIISSLYQSNVTDEARFLEFAEALIEADP